MLAVLWARCDSPHVYSKPASLVSLARTNIDYWISWNCDVSAAWLSICMVQRTEVPSP